MLIFNCMYVKSYDFYTISDIRHVVWYKFSLAYIMMQFNQLTWVVALICV